MMVLRNLGNGPMVTVLSALLFTKFFKDKGISNYPTVQAL